MPEPSPDTAPSSLLSEKRAVWPVWTVRALLGLVVLWLAVEHVRLGQERKYELDDFQYAHASWQMARGEVIYRDFFEHHFPLLHQLLSVVWRFLDDNPDQLGALRLAMIPILALAVCAGAWLNRGRGSGAVLVTAICLLSIPTLSSMATQLRPDILGAALYLSSIASFSLPRTSERLRSLLAGALAAAALWATLKVAYYGLPLVAALVADLMVLWRRRWSAEKGRVESRLFLDRPLAFLAGGSAVGGAILFYLLATGSLDEWFEWGLRFSFTHQYYYPGFPWLRNLDQLLWRSFWLVPFAVVGVVGTWRSLREDEATERRTNLLLLASLVSTLLSFAWQTAPYLYSLIPFSLVAGIFAARGIGIGFRGLSRLGVRHAFGSFGTVLLVLLLGVELSRTRDAFKKLRSSDNSAQRQTLRLLGELTDPADPVFHVWGGQISRPAVHYFFFQEAVTMVVEDERLQREMVPAMLSSGATTYFHQELFPRLVPQLRQYLLHNFLPYNEELWFFGRRYPKEAESGIAGELVAVREDEYFVWPPEAAASGALRIDGKVVESPVFRLQAGRHQVDYSGEIDQLYVVWLPANGEPFEPHPELKPPF